MEGGGDGSWLLGSEALKKSVHCVSSTRDHTIPQKVVLPCSNSATEGLVGFSLRVPGAHDFKDPWGPFRVPETHEEGLLGPLRVWLLWRPKQ